MVGVAADLAAVVGPGNLRELHAYQRAPRCATAPSAPAECRWTDEFTVSDIHVVADYKKGDRNAVLTGTSSARWTTWFNRSGPVLEKLDEGERVTGTVWRGRMTEVTADGATQHTTTAPVDASGSDLSALVLASSGLVSIVACVWRLRRCRGAPPEVLDAMVALSLGMLFVGLLTAVFGQFLSYYLPASLAENFWLLAAIFCAGTAWLTVALRRIHKNEDRLPGIPI